MTMVKPGAGVARNVEIFQLMRIVELAKQGYYGERSQEILERQEKRLTELKA